MLINLFYVLLYVIFSYVFFCELHLLWVNFWWKDKILLYRVDFKSAVFNPKFIISGFATIMLFLCDGNPQAFKSAVFVSYIIRTFICTPDENVVHESCNLNIGFGAALWYYRNYLSIFLPDNFLERVRTFESLNKVEVEKKLFILVPESCVVQTYIDSDEPDFIERCQELPKFEKTTSGIKNRSYNITIYLVRRYQEKKRMAVEYAQPLKGFALFEEKKLITKEEMFNQRKLFVKTLREFLNDRKNSYKHCTIVEYNDNRKVSDVLIEHCQ